MKTKQSWFLERTNNHIKLVNKWFYKINKFLDGCIILHDISDHDSSKFKEPEYTPYVEITWDYKCKDLGIENKLNSDIKEAMNEATLHHVLNNPHHPEYWDPNFDPNMLNRENRDKIPEKMVNATRMPRRYLVEMCADWLAMSEEKGSSPIDWANKNINKRWEFYEKQKNFIYEILEGVWNGN